MYICIPLSITMQTALAVGDTQAEREKAEFTKLKYWVSIHSMIYSVSNGQLELK